MMPRIRNNYIRINFFPYPIAYSEHNFLQNYTHYRGNQRYASRHLQSAAAHHNPYLLNTLSANHHTDRKQRQTDNSRCKRFILAVSICMILILRLTAQFDEDKHHYVSQEITQGMDSIGNHGDRIAQYSGYKFEYYQKSIDNAAQNRNPIYPTFSFHN